jgi:NADPH-dependent curcumin reductase CurA
VNNEQMNNVWRLARRPAEGWPVPDDFLWSEEDLPEPAPNQMLTRTIYLSLDPYQWGRRRQGVEVPGEVCHGRTVSQVLRSRLEGYEEGDLVFNTNGWQSHGLTGDGVSVFGYMFPRKLDPSQAPISTAVGVMGMLGLTAYAGLIVQCQPQPGETVVVSAASGGVGQVVSQLGRIYGCRVVAIAGSEQKIQYLHELGVDAAVSHRSEHFAADLKAACPDGCDVYFENVGGHVFDAVLPLLNPRARISLCGLISQYGNQDGLDPRDQWKRKGADVFTRQQVQVHDLFVGNYVADYQDLFFDEVSEYVRSHQLTYREDLRFGLERAPEVFAQMLQGDNFGKTLVGVSQDPTRPGPVTP